MGNRNSRTRRSRRHHHQRSMARRLPVSKSAAKHGILQEHQKDAHAKSRLGQGIQETDEGKCLHSKTKSILIRTFCAYLSNVEAAVVETLRPLWSVLLRI